MPKIYGALSTTGGPGVSLDRDPTNVGMSPYGLQVAAADPTAPTAYNTTGSFTIAQPGFYYVSGSTFCTGTIPSAGAYPGGHLYVTLTNAQPMQLTGSAVLNTTVFAVNALGATGTLGAANVTQRGNRLTLDSNGSVALQSDGFRWIPYACSGSLSMSLGGAT